MRFEVLLVVAGKITVLWDVTPCTCKKKHAASIIMEDYKVHSSTLTTNTWPSETSPHFYHTIYKTSLSRSQQFSEAHI